MRRLELTGGPCLLLVLALAGCGAPAAPAPAAATSAPAASPSASPPSPVRLPADGVLLRDFGYQFGPLDSFSLPRNSIVSASVDQADNVTVVLSAPAPAAVATYLRRALPAAGFTITAGAAPGGTTLTFTGNGWSGSVTGADATTGVLMRPA